MTPPTLSPVLRRVRHEDSDPTLATSPPSDPRIAWREAFRAVRAETERRAAPLGEEDQMVQSMPDASPAKWHRAHTTWFFEQFLLIAHLPGYRVFDERFAYLFNSYYVAAGPRHARPCRGLLTRPTCGEIAAYRAHVDAAVERLLAGAEDCELRRSCGFLKSGSTMSSSTRSSCSPIFCMPSPAIRSRRLTTPRGSPLAHARLRTNSSNCRGAFIPSALLEKAITSTMRGRRIAFICSRRASRA